MCRTLFGERVKASHHLRTDQTARQHVSSQLIRMEAWDDPEPISLVQVTGRVVQMSKSEMMAVVRIFSEGLKNPFHVTLHGKNSMLNEALDF